MEEKRRTDNYENIGLEVSMRCGSETLIYDFNHYNYYYDVDDNYIINISNIGDRKYIPSILHLFNHNLRKLNSPNDIKFNDVIGVEDFERDINLPKVYHFSLGSHGSLVIFHNAFIKVIHFKHERRFQFTLRTGETLTVINNHIIFREIDCYVCDDFAYQICEKIFENF